MAVPFDLERLKVTGSPALIMEGVRAQFASSRREPWSTCRQAHKPCLGRSQGNGATRGGTSESLRWSSAVAGGPRRLAVEIAGDRGSDIWTYDLDRGTTTRLTFEGGVLPTWTPDGKWVTFSSMRLMAGVWNLFRVAADGSGNRELLTTSDIATCSAPGHRTASSLPSMRGRPPTRTSGCFHSGKSASPSRSCARHLCEAAPTFSPDGRLAGLCLR